MVRFEFGLGGFGGLPATAGPAQTRTHASAALILFMSLERARAPQVGYRRGLLAGRACWRSRAARVGRRCCRRRVLELLLRAEERVERLLAQALAEDECQTDADDDQHEAAAAALLLLRRAQGVGRVAQRVCRLAQLLLRLLVVQRGSRALAVRHAPVSVACRLVGRAQVVAQLVVLDQACYVRVVLGCLPGGPRTGADRGRLFLGCHLYLSPLPRLCANHTRAGSSGHPQPFSNG